MEIAEAIEAPIRLKEIGKRFNVSHLAVKNWAKAGRKNPFTGERIYAQLTWMPGGNWGMTQAQLNDFVARLNEKP